MPGNLNPILQWNLENQVCKADGLERLKRANGNELGKVGLQARNANGNAPERPLSVNRKPLKTSKLSRKSPNLYTAKPVFVTKSHECKGIELKAPPLSNGQLTFERAKKQVGIPPLQCTRASWERSLLKLQVASNAPPPFMKQKG